MKPAIAKVLLTLAAWLALIGPAWPTQAPATAAYLDPSLAGQVGRQSVIVSAASAADAAAVVQAAGGLVTSELWLIDAVAAEVPAAALGQIAAHPGVRSVVANYGVRSSDEGRQDGVGETADPAQWAAFNPVTVDVGADQVHDAPRKGERSRGRDVTVAVVDSGVYFDDAVRAELGKVVTRQFVGQADFIDSTCRTVTNAKGKERQVGKQREDYCWLDHADTADGYGHGTAVASIIWNNFAVADSSGAHTTTLGVAPGASVLSVRVLDDEGVGSYETVIKGIQYVVKHQQRYDVKVLNLSLSAPSSVPYFVDPLSRAVGVAWLKGITVVVAAGNDGPSPGSVTVPGNNPYVITVGALDGAGTPGYFADDSIPAWSASGPTGDGFIKPDLVAPGVNVYTFMHKDAADPSRSQRIVQLHPNNAESDSLFRMNGTSMSAAVVSGVAALVLEAHPNLAPDQVKFRLMASALPAASGAPAQLAYPVFQQGMGRVWAPAAVSGDFSRRASGNPGMNLRADLLHGFADDADLAFHYQGPVQSTPSIDGTATLYYLTFSDGGLLGLGAWAGETGWLDADVLASKRLVWVTGGAPVDHADVAWAGGQLPDPDAVEASKRLVWVTSYGEADLAGWTAAELAALGADAVEASKRLVWVTGRSTWTGGLLWTEAGMAWLGTDTVEASKRLVWVTGRSTWAGGLLWTDAAVEASKRLVWVTAIDPLAAAVHSTSWVETP